MRKATSLASVIVAILLAGVVTVALRIGDRPSPSVGHLATLLADHNAKAVARVVAPQSRSTLSAVRLQSAWDAVTQVSGPMSATTRTIVVAEASDATDEIEVLRFADGHVGTLAARRVGHWIIALDLFAGGTDPVAAAAAAQLALGLVNGRMPDVAAKFDQQMSSVLPLSRLSIDTAAATAGLRGPAHVGAQVVVRQGSYSVVETYLVFANGVRRLETTVGPDGKLAGLYIRPL